jgi:hypothetical protein
VKPAQSTNIFGYANNPQQSHMLFYVGTDNQIHQLFRYQGAWADNALGTLCQQDSQYLPPPPLPGPNNTFGGGTPLTGYPWGGMNYVFYVANVQGVLRIQYIFGGLPGARNWGSGWFDNSNIQPAPGQTGALPSIAPEWGQTDHPGPLLAFASQAAEIQHVLYVTHEGHIIDMYTQGAGLAGRYWKDRTVSTGAQPARAGSTLVGFLAPNGTAQVFCIANDGSIQHLYEQTDGQWGYGDLSTAMRGAPLPVLPPRAMTAYSCAFESTQHMVYLQGVPQQARFLPVHEMYWQNGWNDGEPDLTTITNTPTAYLQSPLCGWSFESEKSEHVIYQPEIQQVGVLFELYHTSAGWGWTDLVKAANLNYFPDGPPIGAPTCGFAAEYEGTNHVWYIDGNGNIRELYRSGNAWHWGETSGS